MIEEELPLFELFSSLQKAGFPLGINEYKVLVEAVANAEELGIKDTQALKRFCRALWVGC